MMDDGTPVVEVDLCLGIWPVYAGIIRGVRTSGVSLNENEARALTAALIEAGYGPDKY